MKKAISILLYLAVLIPAKVMCQSHYEVSRATFSSSKYDEFSPVVYEDLIVFCSNREHDFLINYHNKTNKGLFNIFKVPVNPEADQQKIQIFSPKLVTPFNDGPVSFSPDCTQVVYSRNVDSKAKPKNVINENNTLGLFFAERKEGEWTSIGDFSFNSPDYSITTPCFSADGRQLYFASDMPGGSGGMDIYKSSQSDGIWSRPVNLGETINTSGNEVYPFASPNGDLFFASDGLGGLGKKDIFLTRMSGVDWISPVHLEAPINSLEDDFGFITNREFSEGYYATNRDGSDDIYRFTTLLPQLIDCDTMLYNQYCFEFWDDSYVENDSLPVTYEWEFSDGTKIRGERVEHCLPGAGKHWAKLNIIDSATSATFFTQTTMEFELVDHIQAFITSKEAGIMNNSMEFSGINSNLPGFSIEEYVWDFGDGGLGTGPVVEHQFENAGVGFVKLGLTGYAEESADKEMRCVVKSITLVEDKQALAMHLSGIKPLTGSDLDRSLSNALEVEQALATAGVKIYVLADLDAETNARIKQENDDFADTGYAFKKAKLAENSFEDLHRVVVLMDEHPDLMVEIAVHTDHVNSMESSLRLSRKRAEEIADYLVANGIDPKRLSWEGYGASRPVSTDITMDGRRSNHRVEFLIYKQ